ncbi:HAD family hydrolase [Daejeonella sp.]|uniref:D-glycero-alpha-D-manno-heptose-1,7-bisphosphate 7-phosphatase n=1 Tax=Daejeonella sp. TaxID=2805397 RepID=UPI0030C5C9C5
MQLAVFLDRDGVLNKGYVKDGKSYAPRKIEHFKLLPYAVQSVEKLRKHGFLVIVATNQPDINNGLVTLIEVEKMHLLLKRRTKIDDIFLCPHSKDEECLCRKPKPGMLLDAAKKHNINLSKSFIIGDRSSDIEAGTGAGCRAIFLNRFYKEPKPTSQEQTFYSINAATNYIIKQITNHAHSK